MLRYVIIVIKIIIKLTIQTLAYWLVNCDSLVEICGLGSQNNNKNINVGTSLPFYKNKHKYLSWFYT